MGYPSGQISIAPSLPTSESAPFFSKRAKRLNIPLLAETAVVTIAAILAVRVLSTSSIFAAKWFVAPGILVAASLIPTVIRGDRFPNIGFNNKQIRFTLPILCKVCLVIFPAMFIGLWLLKLCGFELPLRPVLPQNHKWTCWVFYQFMYVAVAEEVFFRGYVQSNILALAIAIKGGRHRLSKWISIVLSAACFAVAHIIVQGQIISVLTFLPGLILGWLFVRTRSLLGPILFHGLANTCYCLIAAVLV